MNVNYRLFLVGFMTLMLLSASVFASSLAAPELDVPKDKAKNQVLTTLLKWKAVPGAKGYRIFVASSADILKNIAPGAACKDCFVDEKSDVPTYKIPPKRFKKDIPYFWTVRAVGDAGEGPNAEIRSYNMASTFFVDMD